MSGGPASRWSQRGVGLHWIHGVSLRDQLAELVSAGGSEAGGWGVLILRGTMRISPAFRLPRLRTHPLAQVTFDQSEARPFVSCTLVSPSVPLVFCSAIRPLTVCVCRGCWRQASSHTDHPSAPSKGKVTQTSSSKFLQCFKVKWNQERRSSQMFFRRP